MTSHRRNVTASRAITIKPDSADDEREDKSETVKVARAEMRHAELYHCLTRQRGRPVP